MKVARLLFLLGVVLAGSISLCAQVSPDLEQGMKPYGSYHGGSLDHVSLSNGNLFFQANLVSYSQRAGELSYPIVLRYNKENYSIYTLQSGCPKCTSQYYAVFSADPMNPSSSLGAAMSIGYDGLPNGVVNDQGTGLSYNDTPISINLYSVQSPDGALRPLVNTGNGIMIASDGSGFRADSVIRESNGTKFNNFAEDANGNQITVSGSGWTDTLGRQIPLMPGPVHPTNTPPANTASLGACPALGYANQPVSFAYAWGLPTVNGGTLPLILCYASVWVHTNFFNGLGNGPKYFDVNQSFTMLQSVVFPDGTYWAFAYDAAIPNNSASYGYGDLLKVTFPTGGSISYTWTGKGSCAGQTLPRAVSTRTVDAADGTGPHTWTYANGVVTDPLGNDTAHTLTGLGGTCSLYETQTQYYQGSHTSGTILKTVNTDYQFTANPYDSRAISTGRVDMAQTVANVFPIRVTTTLPNGLVSKVETDYDTALAYHGPLDGIQYNQQSCYTDPSGVQVCSWTATQTMPVTTYTGSYGKALAVREYDWGHGAPGPLLRQTTTQFLWQANSNYQAANLLDTSCVVTVYGPGTVPTPTGCTLPAVQSNQMAQTTYGYDEYALNASNIGTQHNSSPINGSVRGNLTSVHHWLNGTAVTTANCPNAINNGFATSYTLYNDTGTVYQSTDACGTSAGDPKHTTTHTYDPAYIGAYPTQTCNALNQCVSGAYDFSTGLPVSFTDANQKTSNFSYDQRWRLTQALGPTDPATGLRPETDFDYSVLNQVKRSKKQDASHWIVDYAYFDGLGRIKQTQLVDPEGDDFVDTTYDAAGRVSTVSNPHRSSPSTTDGSTQTQYDALARPTLVTKPDGSVSRIAYEVAPPSGVTGNCTTSTDEAGKQRKACSDALGRLTAVFEDPAGLNYETDYQYNALGNLVRVDQKGSAPTTSGQVAYAALYLRLALAATDHLQP